MGCGLDRKAGRDLRSSLESGSQRADYGRSVRARGEMAGEEKIPCTP